MTAGAEIPWDRIDTLFLDAGNTLVSVDFAWVRDELEALGIACRTEEVRRAEAAARPTISNALSARESGEGPGAFLLYLKTVFAHLPAIRQAGVEDVAGIAETLAPILSAPGQNSRLWSHVLPGVRESLARFRARNLRLVVVSNSDGSIEEGLSRLGLRDYFDAVVDSSVVGYEKPDPRIFAHALALVAADPNRTLHVGDMLYADVEGARRAGVHGVLLDPYSDWDECDATRLPDLPAVDAALSRALSSDAAD
jgi:HAD superfamily hydrolase (TIGR01509 family)